MENYINFGSYPYIILAERETGKTTTAAQICNNFPNASVYYFGTNDNDKEIFENIIKNEHTNNYYIRDLSISNINTVYNSHSYGYKKGETIIVIDGVDSIIKKSSYESLKVFYDDEYIDEYKAYINLINNMLKFSKHYEDLIIIMTVKSCCNFDTKLMQNIIMMSKIAANMVINIKDIPKEIRNKIKEEIHIFDSFNASYIFVNNSATDVNVHGGHRLIINNATNIPRNVISFSTSSTIRDSIIGNVSDTVKNMVKEIVKDYIKNNIKDIIKETIEEELKEL